MSLEKFNAALPIVEQIRQIEAELERFPRDRGELKFRRKLQFWKKDFPTEKTSNGRFFVTTGYFDGGMIELDDEDIKILMDKRKERLKVLNEKVNDALKEEVE